MMHLRQRVAWWRLTGTVFPVMCIILASAAAQEDRFDECDRWVRDEPGAVESYECYENAARVEGEFDEAVRRLEAILQVHPERYHAWSVLGSVERLRGNARAATPSTCIKRSEFLI